MLETVAILGASSSQSRYSYKAQRMLIEEGHTAVPINPKYKSIDGLNCYDNLKLYSDKIDTITVYVRPSISMKVIEDIIQVAPRRVILNPGADNRQIIDKLRGAGIQVETACTLVLLRTGQF